MTLPPAILAVTAATSLLVAAPLRAAHPQAAPGLTTLTNPALPFTPLDVHHRILRRGAVTAIIVDNEAVDLPELPGHRAGYNGVASLRHDQHPENLFVPAYAGLNFEHIHDGTTAGLVEPFEPRRFPMQLRLIDDHTVEVYQAPTGNWKLESCGRYTLLKDGTLEYAFECIPRALPYRRGFIGLFWASYLNRPGNHSIFFMGRPGGESQSRWIEAVSPSHGLDGTHGPLHPASLPEIDPDFPLSLVNHPSRFRYAEPWYYGISNGRAFVQIFRDRDQVWFAQSPSGGGTGNPAWDFQWFIHHPEVGKAFGFVMRAACLPFEDRASLAKFAASHRQHLDRPQP